MEAEHELAGAILNKPEKIAEIWGTVEPQDFEDSRAGNVLQMAYDHFSQSIPFDLVVAASIRPELTTFYASISNPFTSNIKQYASLIRDAGRKRRILAGLSDTVNAPGTADEMLDVISDIHSQEQKAIRRNPAIKEVVTRTDAIVRENHRRGKPHGIGTGFDFLDNIFVRYVPGHIWVITGFTSVGKTALLTEMISRIGKNRVALVSTEMTEEQMVARFVSQQTGMHSQKVLSGQMSKEEWPLYDKAMNSISGRDLQIVDSIYDTSEIESFVLQRSMAGGIDVVFVDYVQNCTCRGVQKKEEGPEMARRLQHLAKKAKTCVVCLSQVSNQVGRGEVEQFEAKGAGEWAAVADVGIRLKRNKEDESLLLFDMQKGRHYRKIEQKLQFKNNFTKISEWVI